MISCSYELQGRTWVCKAHNKPSKHKVDKNSGWPCLAVDSWTVKELDALHEEAGLYDQWMTSPRRKELADKEEAQARTYRKNG